MPDSPSDDESDVTTPGGTFLAVATLMMASVGVSGGWVLEPGIGIGADGHRFLFCARVLDVVPMSHVHLTRVLGSCPDWSHHDGWQLMFCKNDQRI